MVHKPIITPKGTELPLLDFRGKPYLQVAHRLVWFREEKQTWGIITKPLSIDETQATFMAQITDDTGRIIATGTKQETKTGFADFIEKAETGSIGRALALCGYGTQFAPELDEESRIVDSPMEPAKKPVSRVAEIMGTAKAEVEKASPSQLKTLADLAVKKLGANAKDKQNILDSLNAELRTSFKSALDISKVQADTIIAALEPKPNFELPYEDSPRVE